MKAVLRSLLCMLLILTAFVNTGCAKGADEDADYKVYYLNKENTKKGMINFCVLLKHTLVIYKLTRIYL